jgi:hypothetical protein
MALQLPKSSCSAVSLCCCVGTSTHQLLAHQDLAVVDTARHAAWWQLLLLLLCLIGYA